jgi:DNA polymerase V
MIFHIDGNSFYASCERLFRPDLYNRPIAVLTNNDGIIIALDQLCKDLGFRRGDVYFKVRREAEEKGVTVFSSNYTLYADISGRLNALYSRYSMDVELYSIDESFLYFPDWSNADYTDIGRTIREAAGREVSIPVSVGIAPTKTLAKLCNKLAKKNGGVMEWEKSDKDTILKNYPAGDVWGVGAAKTSLLQTLGVHTAFDLKNLPLDIAKKKLTITGVKTVQELNGTAVIGRIYRDTRDQIVCSRSFSAGVYYLDELLTALSGYTQEAVKRLRDDRLQCTLVTVYLMTSPYDTSSQYSNQETARFTRPTAHLPEIQGMAALMLRSIFRDGYKYRKVMIQLSGIVHGIDIQRGLFDNTEGIERREKLMNCFDGINEKYGKGAIRLGSSSLAGEPDGGKAVPWAMRRDFLSPEYTTRLGDVPKVY